VVNATSIGLYPDIDGRLNLDVESLRPSLVVADVIPNPPRTPLVRDAEVRGCRVLDGLDMIVNQGIMGIKYWTGVDVEASVMRKELESLFCELINKGQSRARPKALLVHLAGCIRYAVGGPLLAQPAPQADLRSLTLTGPAGVDGRRTLRVATAHAPVPRRAGNSAFWRVGINSRRLQVARRHRCCILDGEHDSHDQPDTPGSTYNTAIGFPGEPVAPTIGTGAKT
jgi:Shikimate 5'-dehydrogenase C-terminal domain